MSTRVAWTAALMLAIASVSYAQAQPGGGTRPLPPGPPPAQREPVVGPPSKPPVGPIQTPTPPLRFSKFPVRSVPVLGRLPYCDGTAANSTNTPCRRATGGSDPIPADRQIPARDLEVITAGGIAPVQISFDAGKFNDWFELVTPRGGTPVPGSAVSGIVERPGAGLTIGKDPRPAEATRRIIRFKGLPNWTGSPQEIVVLVRATDGRGSAVTDEFRIYPYSPRLESVAGQPVFKFKNAAPRFELRQIGAATEVYVHEISSPCGWAEQNSLQTLRGAVKIAPRTGDFSLTRRGIFRSGSTCHFALALSFRFPFQPAGASELASFTEPEVRLKSVSLPLEPAQTYRITDTWQLKERFNWFSSTVSGVGVCRGKSQPGDHDVGVLQANGDLSFKIRSGPIGTRCQFLDTGQRLLPDGMRFVSSVWKVNATEKCRAPDMSGTEATVDESGVLSYNFGRNPWTRAPVMGQVGSFSNPLMDPQNAGIVLLDVPGGATSGTHRVVLRPLEVRVECDSTLVNDHSVRLTLDEITFSGPPGLPFP